MIQCEKPFPVLETIFITSLTIGLSFLFLALCFAAAKAALDLKTEQNVYKDGITPRHPIPRYKKTP